MSDEIVFLETKTWDEWVKANPNLSNLKPKLFISTAETDWKKFELGWVDMMDEKFHKWLDEKRLSGER